MINLSQPLYEYEDFFNLYELYIQEELTSYTDLKFNSSKDTISRANFFSLQKPQGIIIQDTYNNFAFPLERPVIDTNKMDLLHLIKNFRIHYSLMETHMLPWHYVIEMIDDKYFVFNTRPLTMKYPLTSKEVIERKKLLPNHITWNENTEKFFDEQPFDVSEAIHVAIIGNSNIDIYPKQIYKVIGSYAMRPIYYYFKIPDELFLRTFPLNLGDRFKMDVISKFIKL